MKATTSLGSVLHNEAKEIETWQEQRFPDQPRVQQTTSLPAEHLCGTPGARHALLKSAASAPTYMAISLLEKTKI